MIEKPLWAFVESKVMGRKNGKFTKTERETISDVLDVVKFLKKITENKSLLENNISKIFNEDSGLLDKEVVLWGQPLTLDIVYKKLRMSNVKG